VANYRRMGLAALVFAIALGGCGSPYMRDRGRDFADIWRLSGGIGPGIEAHARISRLPQLGAGHYQGLKIGMVGRECGQWYEWRYDFNVITGWGTSTRTRYLGTIVDHPHSIGKDCEWSLGDNNRRWGELAITFWFVAVGAEAGFDVIELADFVVGWTTWDFMSDDGEAQAGEPVEIQQPLQPYIMLEEEPPAEPEQPAKTAEPEAGEEEKPAATEQPEEKPAEGGEK